MKLCDRFKKAEKLAAPYMGETSLSAIDCWEWLVCTPEGRKQTRKWLQAQRPHKTGTEISRMVASENYKYQKYGAIPMFAKELIDVHFIQISDLPWYVRKPVDE